MKLSDLAVCFLFAQSAVVHAQYMQDTSSVYSDSWATRSGIVGLGQVSGSLAIHRYAVDVTIQSPSGRTANATGSYSSGFVSNSTMLPYSGETGNYVVAVKQRLYCTVSGYTPVLAYRQFWPNVAYAITGFKWPVLARDGNGWYCHYPNLACDRGQARCTSGGWTDLNWTRPIPPCPNKILVEFLRVVIGPIQACFPFDWDAIEDSTLIECQ